VCKSDVSWIALIANSTGVKCGETFRPTRFDASAATFKDPVLVLIACLT